jgi:hypothetical protein
MERPSLLDAQGEAGMFTFPLHSGAPSLRSSRRCSHLRSRGFNPVALHLLEQHHERTLWPCRRIGDLIDEELLTVGRQILVDK